MERIAAGSSSWSSPSVGTSRPLKDFRLLCDSSASTHPGIDVPVESFSNSRVHLLTPNETVTWMWLDVPQNPMPEDPYITGFERAGHFGPGRDAYEAHE
ncbi:hypothetical protein [Streptomyces antibioticus]|uniref:hypothetical protein n=1 Tax=Streptomyces antibioticus TaxID=1890 RepID=UPI00224F6B72|nr:hypothetical protein [Streptomyces antibioticus]MCX4740798.1 hypothetical protein [Streptomyces antibioticus]